MFGDRTLVEAVLKDYRTAPISEAEKTLLALIEKINRQPNQITQADIDLVKAAGWSEEAVYDAITVCALFRFYNTWVDATGVEVMSDAAHEMSGQRIAAFGYASSSEDSSEA